MSHLKPVLIKGISDVWYMEFNKILLKYVFGYDPGIKLRISILWFLWGPLGPLSPGLPGTSDILNDIRNWLRQDSPSPTSMVKAKSLLRLLVYLVPGLWLMLDFYYFAYWIFMAHVPVASMVCSYFLMIRLALGVEWQHSIVRWAEWVLEERSTILPYGVISYVLLLRGQTFPFAIFLFSSDVLRIRWSSTSNRSKIISRLFFMAGPAFLLYLLRIPLIPVRSYRQTLKIPYWWASWQVKKIWRTFAQKSAGKRQGVAGERHYLAAKRPIRV